MACMVDNSYTKISQSGQSKVNVDVPEDAEKEKKLSFERYSTLVTKP